LIFEVKEGVDAKVLLPHIIELRALAVRQPGYISGDANVIHHPITGAIVSLISSPAPMVRKPRLLLTKSLRFGYRYV
jgi:hypothetical protein